MAGRFSEADHRRVTAAVTLAEAGSDGEIVTIVADASDRYRDVALGWMALAMLGVPLLLALVPAGELERRLSLGWTGGPVYGELLALVAAGQLALAALVWLVLRIPSVRVALAPPWTRRRRVRRRAVKYFLAAAEKRTRGLTGILVYLSLAEHRAEIVADRAIHSQVDEDVWADAMAALIGKVRAGDPAGGMVEAVERIGHVLAEHFPRSDGDRNELPDRLIEL